MRTLFDTRLKGLAGHSTRGVSTCGEPILHSVSTIRYVAEVRWRAADVARKFRQERRAEASDNITTGADSSYAGYPPTPQQVIVHPMNPSNGFRSIVVCAPWAFSSSLPQHEATFDNPQTQQTSVRHVMQRTHIRYAYRRASLPDRIPRTASEEPQKISGPPPSIHSSGPIVFRDCPAQRTL
jgi:hypothetical protein